MKAGARTIALALAIGALLATSEGAVAVQWPIGETAWSPTAQQDCLSSDHQDALQLSLDSNLGRGYATGPGGAVTSWSTLAGGASTQSASLKVFRAIAPNVYLVVGQDGPRPLVPNTLNTFQVAIPVQAGDMIGLSIPAGSPTSCRFEAKGSERVGFAKGDAGVGATAIPESSVSGSRLNVSATVLPPPVTISTQPDHGSFQGGRRVSVFGDNFFGVRGVSFGSVPAPSFEVVSESLIVAVSPPGRLGSRVPVAVTTAAGSATLDRGFAYRGCRVPRLQGGTLKAAKKRVRKAGCRVGKVEKRDGATAKSGRVVAQSPKPGRILSPNAKVSVSLGS